MTTTIATRRLAAVLAADVVGYSRLMGVDEEGTHERLKAHLREVVDPKIREHRGRIVKTTGDGVLADRDLDVAEERRLRFRIGVNVGDVIADADDIYGDGVNIAARLEALAAPGSICVSGIARDHIGDRLPYGYDDIGEQSVKNIARPVRAYALRAQGVAPLPAPALSARPSRRGPAIVGTVVAAALLIIRNIASWFRPTAISHSGAGKPAKQSTASPAPMSTAPAAVSVAQAVVAPRLSIVVLPFANLSNDPDLLYIDDAITE